MSKRIGLVLSAATIVLVAATGSPSPAEQANPAPPRCGTALATPPGSKAAASEDAPGEQDRVATDHYRQGRFDEAAALWLEAAQGYESDGEAARETAARVRLAQAYQALGQLDRTVESLERASQSARLAGADRGAVLVALGEAYLALGAPERADEVLSEALEGARPEQRGRLVAAAWNAQGSVRAALGEDAEAASLYRQSAVCAAQSGDALLAASARANAARAALAAGQLEVGLANAERAVDEARALPDSDAKARVLLHVGRSYQRLARDGAADPTGAHALASSVVLTAAAHTSERVGASRSASFAWGLLGQLYEQEGRNEDAIELTRRALFAAQSAAAPEALYRWQWQLGRLWRASDRSDEAIQAYRAAARTLDTLRGQRPIDGSDDGFDTAVRPVYFGLVDLLLQRAAQTPEREQHQALMREARDTVESLKVAELRDYFEDECVVDQPARAPDSIPGTVVVYPIVLPDRIELIVSSTSGLRSFVVPVSEERLVAEVRAFRRLLERLSTRQYRRHAQQLYDWLVRPIEEELDESLDALVFVQGGALRTIPPAALYDAETGQFLIQKHPLAVTPGLTLTDPQPIDPEHVRLLIAGLSDAVQGFPALDAVEMELQSVQETFEGTGEMLVNESFLTQSFEDAITGEAFGIVHIASHGEFSGRSEESFVLTYDDRLSMGQLSRLAGLSNYREQSLELLTLSACQTAVGDDRAALGLAGLAVQSGARSALATLWYISDEASSELVTHFYRELRKPGVSRAEALRRAQVRFIEDPSFRHPGYWAPFLLIGSWL